MRVKSFILTVSISLLCFLNSSLFADDYNLNSPNNRIRVKISVGDEVKWSVNYLTQKLLIPSPMALTIDGKTIPGKKPEVINASQTRIAEEIDDVIGVKSKKVMNLCNELTLEFSGNYSIVFRVYDNGCAYRFVTNFDSEVKVNSEDVVLNFADDFMIYYPEEDGFISHFERIYLHQMLSVASKEKFCSLPALVDASNGIKIGITDAGLYDYPSMFLIGTGFSILKGVFPKYVLEAKPAEEGPDRNEVITKEADYIASTKGKRSFPWRLLMISENDAQLVENQLPFILSDPLKLDDTDWIKPGKVAWDWWNDRNIYGVDFKSGINTDTYKYYIDFAGRYNIDYIILDEGWSKTSTNILEANPELDLQELIRYGNEKNVGIILWTLWKPLNENLEIVLDKYAQWGVKGIKVDFMQRADQWMVNYHERVSQEAAKRKLLVDFHGAFKPSGLRRPYPNFISNEGVKGLENCKWSKDITPEHDVTLPFTRMLAGPMDYTPGAMTNMNEYDFKIIFSRPMSMGTRCHQLAMYVVYESPLQMLADSPTNYLKEPETTEFISKIPTTWDETKVLDAKTGDYILTARKKENTWYLGAMTDWESRDMTVDLSFLDNGQYKIEIMQDGINSERVGNDYKKVLRDVTKKDKLEIHLASGGGWAAIISEK